jgi:hypothetical protein
MGGPCSTNGGEEEAYRLMWTGLVWLRIGTGGELLCEFGI